jgi:ABC-type polysaccharide/polyol phosphate transport system ATPase subunit
VSATPAITVSGVSKRFRLYHERNQSLKVSVMRGRRARYEEFWALQDVSFDVPVGSTFGLIGENGSGKSTMLKCIAKILRPDHGTIASRGKISALLELGAGFHQDLSGRENVYLNGAILGLTRKQLDARFDDIVGFAGIEQFIDTPVRNYSSGMYVRLGFSVAINVDPDILLVDEILAVGDAEFQRRCLERFDEMRASGKTIVIVTHALGSVRNLCDELALLEHGQLRRVGPPAEVIDEYLGDVFEDRVQDGEFGERWGSGEGVIERVELLDAGGQPTKRIRTGDPMVLRMHYAIHEPLGQPVFGMAIQRMDGAEVTGQNTRDAGLVIDHLDGSGYIDLRIDRLMLVPGTYDLNVSLANFSLSHTYDFRYRVLRFDVEAGDPYAELGVLVLDATWSGTPLPE